jgi:hypothetical protein
MNSLQVMKQTLAYLENGHFTYETKIADDLRAAIKQEALNLKAENARELGLNYEPVPVKTYSGGKAWPVQVEWVWLTDEQIEEAVRGAGMSFTPPDFKVARAIEAKLKEMNPKG